MIPISLQSDIESEIMAGLPNEQERRRKALLALDYYCLRGASLIPKRDAETDQDYRNRPKRSLPFTRRVVDLLCRHLYAPGPARRLLGDDALSRWLDDVYAVNLVNSLWQRADRMSTLGGVSAFQAAATGRPDRPVNLQLWGGWNELCLHADPTDANRVASVITIDAVDNQTRYTWWTEEWFRVYETDKLKPGQTADGRRARFRPDLSGENPYGILPFAFVWHDLPISGFDTIEGVGPYLAAFNGGLDVEMSDMAQAVRTYHAPVPVAYDADVSWQPLLAMGKWLRVNSVPTDLERGPAARLEFLQPALDIAGGWTNIKSAIDAVLEGMGCPLSTYRMDAATLPSGAAILAEQKPLLDHAIERREPFRRYEADLATVVLTVAGRLAPGATPPALTLAWPPPSIDTPGADRDQSDQASLEMGLESRVMIVMRRHGIGREAALAHLRQAADDEAALAARPTPADTEAPPAEDDDGDPAYDGDFEE